MSTPAAEASPTSAIGFIVAPDGQAGGGMGRVKDYILQYGAPRALGVTLVPLITRDAGGGYRSLALTVIAIIKIASARISGRLAFVHVNFGDKGSAVRKGAIVVATNLLGGRVLLHLHAVRLHHHYAKSGRLVRWLIRWPFRSSTRVAVLGESWRRWVIRELGVPSERVEVLWNGVPIEGARERDLSIAAPPVELLFLGNLIERKGVSDLIAAARRLPPDITDWRLTFAGGGDIDSYSDAVRKAGLSDRISFVGWVDQVRAERLVNSSDLLVLPSYDEGLPLVILEALGSGTPVVCTPVGSIPEVLIDRETAMFCAPGDSAGLTAALQEMIENRDLRVRISKAGLSAFAKRFSIDAFLTALFDLYRDGLGVDIRLAPSAEVHGDQIHKRL